MRQTPGSRGLTLSFRLSHMDVTADHGDSRESGGRVGLKLDEARVQRMGGGSQGGQHGPLFQGVSLQQAEEK